MSRRVTRKEFDALVQYLGLVYDKEDGEFGTSWRDDGALEKLEDSISSLADVLGADRKDIKWVKREEDSE